MSQYALDVIQNPMEVDWKTTFGQIALIIHKYICAGIPTTLYCVVRNCSLFHTARHKKCSCEAMANVAFHL